MDRRKAIKKMLRQSTGLMGSLMLIQCNRYTDQVFDHLLENFDDHLPPSAEWNFKNSLFSSNSKQLSTKHAHQSKAAHADQIDDLAFDNMNTLTESFDQNHAGDIYLDKKKQSLILSCHQKLTAFNNYIGYANFNLTSFDDLIYYTRMSGKLQAFNRQEKEFIDEIFHTPAEKYGFYGTKLQKSLTTKINNRDVVKIPKSGHYLYREISYPIYQKIKRDVGHSIILTSGIRNTMKQFHLFFAKTIKSNFNLSQASRSLAPPGYSYHSVGDFDVGKKGLGYSNFTSKFSQTEEYKKLTDLGYIDIRYPTNNPFGVRFEPWHIEGKNYLV